MTRGNHVALPPKALEKLSKILVVINLVLLGRTALLQPLVVQMYLKCLFEDYIK